MCLRAKAVPCDELRPSERSVRAPDSLRTVDAAAHTCRGFSASVCRAASMIQDRAGIDCTRCSLAWRVPRSSLGLSALDSLDTCTVALLLSALSCLTAFCKMQTAEKEAGKTAACPRGLLATIPVYHMFCDKRDKCDKTNYECLCTYRLQIWRTLSSLLRVSIATRRHDFPFSKRSVNICRVSESGIDCIYCSRCKS